MPRSLNVTGRAIKLSQSKEVGIDKMSKKERIFFSVSAETEGGKKEWSVFRKAGTVQN